MAKIIEAQPELLPDNGEPSPDNEHRSPLVRYSRLNVEEGIPYSRTHLAALEARGEFPRRIKLSANVIAWDRAEVRAWRRSRGRG